MAAKREPLNSAHVKENDYSLYRAAIREFPYSWGKALRAAGLSPDDHQAPRECWDEQKAERWVRERLANRTTIRALDAPSKLFQFVREHLQLSWADYIESLGIVDQRIQRKRRWDRAKVISEIRCLKSNGQPLNSQAVGKVDQSLVVQARKFFCSWDRARAAAKV